MNENSPIPPRTQWLQVAGTPIRVMALALLVAEGCYGALIFKLPTDHQLAGFSILGGLIFATMLVLYAVERLRTATLSMAGNRVIAREIPNREQLYRELVRVIAGSSVIFDTSWGRMAGPLTKNEKEARKKYRKAVDDALENGKFYRELFSSTDINHPIFDEAKATTLAFPNYRARAVKAELSELSILDFGVFDSRRVIISHVDAQTELPMFLYIESPEIAELFKRFHSECWATAEPIQPSLTPPNPPPKA